MLGKFEICFEIGAISYSGWNHNGFNKTTKSHQFHVWIFMVFHIWNSYYFMEQHVIPWTRSIWFYLDAGRSLAQHVNYGTHFYSTFWWSWYSCMWRPLTIQTNWKLMESCFIQEIKHLVALISLFVVTFHNSNQLGAHGNLFRHIHWRLQEIKPVYNKTFGRVDILACGDHPPTKPIGSSWISCLVE